ncbi:hypothetical protein L6R49_15295 [Myxococcota bacterium]|nr:hypothetical protein [Myxococcota bacterium]
MSALAVVVSLALGLGLGLAALGGRLAGRGVALALVVIAAVAAWRGAWAIVGPSAAVAALLVGQGDEEPVFRRPWAPLALCVGTFTLAAWWTPAAPIPAPAVAAGIEALRDAPWLAFGAAALVLLVALTPPEGRR